MIEGAVLCHCYHCCMVLISGGCLGSSGMLCDVEYPRSLQKHGLTDEGTSGMHTMDTMDEDDVNN